MGSAFKIIIIFLGIIIVANLAFLDFVWTREKSFEKKELSQATSLSQKPEFIDSDNKTKTCPDNCLTKIQQEIAKITPAVNLVQENKKTTSLPTSAPVNSKNQYLTVLTSGTSASISWTDIPSSDFYFDLVDYPGMKSIRWEASLRALNGSATVYARLYDVTNSRGIDGSDIETNSASFTFIRSSELTIWNGNNLYRVQLRSVNGTQADLQTARLKIGF